MTLGFGTILIAHITFNIPYVILSVAPKLKQTNRYTYEAALDLGASPLKAFFKVVFPDIVPGVLSGFMILNNEILSISKKNSSRQWKTHLN